MSIFIKKYWFEIFLIVLMFILISTIRNLDYDLHALDTDMYNATHSTSIQKSLNSIQESVYEMNNKIR